MHFHISSNYGFFTHGNLVRLSVLDADVLNLADKIFTGEIGKGWLSRKLLNLTLACLFFILLFIVNGEIE